MFLALLSRSRLVVWSARVSSFNDSGVLEPPGSLQLFGCLIIPDSIDLDGLLVHNGSIRSDGLLSANVSLE